MVMKVIEQLTAKVRAWEEFLAEAQAELVAAMKESYKERLHAEKMERFEIEWGDEDDPLYSPEAVREMRAHKETRMYLTADGKKHWYVVSEEPGSYQGA